MSSNAKSHPFVLLSVNFQFCGEIESTQEFEFGGEYHGDLGWIHDRWNFG